MKKLDLLVKKLLVFHFKIRIKLRMIMCLWKKSDSKIILTI